MIANYKSSKILLLVLLQLALIVILLLKINNILLLLESKMEQFLFINSILHQMNSYSCMNYINI